MLTPRDTSVIITARWVDPAKGIRPIPFSEDGDDVRVDVAYAPNV